MMGRLELVTRRVCDWLVYNKGDKEKKFTRFSVWRTVRHRRLIDLKLIQW